jgi:hypothetical protein
MRTIVPVEAVDVDEAAESVLELDCCTTESGVVRTHVYGNPDGDGTAKQVYCSGQGNDAHGSRAVVLVGTGVLVEYGAGVAVGYCGAAVGYV